MLSIYEECKNHGLDQNDFNKSNDEIDENDGDSSSSSDSDGNYDAVCKYYQWKKVADGYLRSVSKLKSRSHSLFGKPRLKLWKSTSIKAYTIHGSHTNYIVCKMKFWFILTTAKITNVSIKTTSKVLISATKHSAFSLVASITNKMKKFKNYPLR